MPSRIRHGLLIIVAVIGLFFASVITSYAQTITYVYDDLDRLIRVVYDSGTVIQYTYDEVGNRSEEKIELDTTPPTGTIVINSGATYANSTSVTLTLSCSDTNGCSQMKFSKGYWCQVLKCESRTKRKSCQVCNVIKIK